MQQASEWNTSHPGLTEGKGQNGQFPKTSVRSCQQGPEQSIRSLQEQPGEAWVQQGCVCATAGGLTSSSQQIAAIGINNFRREMCLSLLLRQSSSKTAVQAGSQPLVSASICTALLNSVGKTRCLELGRWPCCQADVSCECM